MPSEVHEAGDNDSAKDGEVVLLRELKEELARLRENDLLRQDKLKQLVKDNEKMRDQLRVLERLVVTNPDLPISPKSSKTVNVGKESDQAQIQLSNHHLTKTLIKLTCECIVINKKFKYLRRLMKMNHRKLTDIENATKIGMEQHMKMVEDKICQVALNGDCPKCVLGGKVRKSVAVGTATSQDRLKAETSDEDMLISDVFYLPTRPDLPDLRLFELL